jgi:hypothetical protein
LIICKVDIVDQMHGKGKYTWANGEIFEGEFKNGKPVK